MDSGLMSRATWQPADENNWALTNCYSLSYIVIWLGGTTVIQARI